MAGAFSSAFSSAFDIGGGGAAVTSWLYYYLQPEQLAVLKNVAGQKLTVFAFDSTTGLPKTGDAANITAYYDLDDAGTTVLTDTSASERDSTNAKGYYIFDLAQGETNGNKIAFSAKSSTSNIVVIAVPAVVYTLPAAGIGTSTLTQTQVSGGAYALNSASFAFNAALDFTTTQKAATLARVTLTDTLTTYTGNTVQTGDSYAQTNSGTFGLAAIKGYVDDIGVAGAGLTALGDTRLAHLDADISSRGTSTLTQTQVTGGAYALNNASFAFNAGLDFTATQKAATLARVTLVDTTTTNTDMVTAAGFRSAVGLAAANLDTQLSTIAGYIDTEVATLITSVGAGLNTLVTAVKAKTDNLPAAPASTTNITAASGVVLAAAGLDSITATAPSGVASNFREMLVQVWRRFFKKSTLTATQLKTYADDGTTVVTTQTVSDDGTTQTQGVSS